MKRPLLYISTLMMLAGCKPPAWEKAVRTCWEAEEAQAVVKDRENLIGKSEYDILNEYGKPAHISMNQRSEKEYMIPQCDSAASVVIRFSGTGRVKEVFLMNNEQ